MFRRPKRTVPDLSVRFWFMCFNKEAFLCTVGDFLEETCIEWLALPVEGATLDARCRDDNFRGSSNRTPRAA